MCCCCCCFLCLIVFEWRALGVSKGMRALCQRQAMSALQQAGFAAGAPSLQRGPCFSGNANAYWGALVLFLT